MRQDNFTLPAGQIEPGEEPLPAARRELLEETGYRAERWSRLGAFCMSSNAGVGTASVFLARGCQQVQAPESGDYEAMEIVLMTPHEASEAFRNGDIVLMGSALALGLYLADALHPQGSDGKEDGKA